MIPLIYTKRKIYDNLLILLIASLAFGSFGGALQIPRILSIIVLPFFISNSVLGSKTVVRIIRIVVCFLGYCIFSLLWTSNIEEGFVELIYYILHFLLFVEIITFSMCAVDPKSAISNGWLVAVALTAVVAGWEIATGDHLPYCRNDATSMVNVDGTIMFKSFVAAAFVNYNTYVTFLCFAIPFLLYIISKRKDDRRGLYWMSIVLVIASVFFILKNGSRGGFISIIVMIATYFMLKPKNISWIIAIVVLLFIVFYVFTRYGDQFVYLSSRVSGGNLIEGGERLIVWEYTLKRFISTYGFGVGIGGMEDAMQGVASDIKIPHNIFLEILLQFGIVFFLIFVVFLINLFRRAKKINDFPTKVTLYSALIAFPIYGIINSGYLFNPFVYAGLAALFVYLQYFQNERS